MTQALRRDGPAKLTGETRYTADLVFPGAWSGATVRSSEPRARLDAIEIGGALDPAVVIVTAADIPGDNVVALKIDDQPVLVPVGGEIKHHAEPVALVAAPDKALLDAAMRAIRLRTTPLPPVLDPLGSEHELARYSFLRGDPDGALAAADLVVEGTYRVGHQEHLYIEGQAIVAVPRDGGGVTVHGSMQCPFHVRNAMKRALRMSDEQAVVVQAETGGAFGGKEDYPSMLAIHAALLALRCRRPVRMVYGRHEDLSATTKRHPAIVRHRTGVGKDGRLIAQEIDIVMDGGAYTTLTPSVLARASVHAAGPYACPNVRITGRAVATNTPPNGAFRGYGATQAAFAAETQMNRVAEALGADPLELRRRWVYREGDVTPTGQVLRDGLGGLDVLDAVACAADLERETAATRRERATRPEGARRASGVGLALTWRGAGFTGNGEMRFASVASVELGDDRQVRILTSATELGQGTNTILPQLVAATLGIAAADVIVVPQDTSIVPNSGPTTASRTAMVVGGLLIKAARRLREEVEAETGRPFAESYRTAAPRRIDERFAPYPGHRFDDATYTGDAYPAYGWAGCVAKVDVDLDTGEVTVREVLSADDVGHVIHRVLAEGQIEGATLQAVGYATIEEVKLVDGRYLNDRMSTYTIPTALDAPLIRSILVERPFTAAPHHAKSLGELPIDVAAPAVIAAIHDATGVWVHELPATPERILPALPRTR